MTVHRTHEEPSRGPLCFTITIEMSFYVNFLYLFCVVLLVLFAHSSTNIDPLHVLSTMAPKQDRSYTHGQSKSVTPSARMIIGSNDEGDIEYVPPGTSTPSRAESAPTATPKKVASGVVTAS